MTVAPHAGAWIETVKYVDTILQRWSRPMRARGLKHMADHQHHAEPGRAPCGRVD